MLAMVGGCEGWGRKACAVSLHYNTACEALCPPQPQLCHGISMQQHSCFLLGAFKRSGCLFVSYETRRQALPCHVYAVYNACQLTRVGKPRRTAADKHGVCQNRAWPARLAAAMSPRGQQLVAVWLVCMCPCNTESMQ